MAQKYGQIKRIEIKAEKVFKVSKKVKIYSKLIRKLLQKIVEIKLSMQNTFFIPETVLIYSRKYS